VLLQHSRALLIELLAHRPAWRSRNHHFSSSSPRWPPVMRIQSNTTQPNPIQSNPIQRRLSLFVSHTIGLEIVISNCLASKKRAAAHELESCCTALLVDLKIQQLERVIESRLVELLLAASFRNEHSIPVDGLRALRVSGRRLEPLACSSRYRLERLSDCRGDSVAWHFDCDRSRETDRLCLHMCVCVCVCVCVCRQSSSTAMTCHHRQSIDCCRVGVGAGRRGRSSVGGERDVLIEDIEEKTSKGQWRHTM